MPNADPRRIVRRWLRGWALVDIVVLGGGLVAARYYFSYWKSHQATPDAWFDIWPGMTTEVLGTWLSVRLIDHLIRRRERRSAARWRQARILVYLRNLSKDIAERPRARTIQLLADELVYFAEPHNVRAREQWLDASEREELHRAMKLVKDLVILCGPYLDISMKLEACRHDAPEHFLLTSEQERLHSCIRGAVAELSVAFETARKNILAEEFEDQ